MINIGSISNKNVVDAISHLEQCKRNIIDNIHHIKSQPRKHTSVAFVTFNSYLDCKQFVF